MTKFGKVTAKSITDLSDAGAFESIFKAYYDQLTGFAYQYVNGHETAEEIVQETFSNIWLKADKINVKTSVKSYLYGAVRNACLNHLKHEKVKRRHQDEQLLKNNLDTYDEVNFLELDELQQEIENAIEKLPEKCKEIFLMSRYEEKKNKEIAAELGLSLKTIENQMGRALKSLRLSLGKYLPGVLIAGISWLIKSLWG